jgi:cytochrome c556
MKDSAAVIPAAGVMFAVALCLAADAEGDALKVQSLHADLITPASDALFQAESKPPVTAAQWTSIASRAADLVRAAKALESMESVKGQTQWFQFARALAEAAEQAAQAAQAQNQDALVSANGDIVSVCEDCHAKYRDGGRSMKE